MKKMISCILCLLLLGTAMITAAACGKEPDGGLNAGEYRLSYESSGGGYEMRISRGGQTYSTAKGGMGVRFDRNEFRAGDPVYAHYASVQELAEGYLATGSVTSESGTVIAFEDYYTLSEHRLYVDRRFSVQQVGQDRGFMTELPLTDRSGGTLLESEWFVPSTYYVTGTHTFSDTSTRMYFSGQELVVPADDVSALTVSRYCGKDAASMADTTPGYRENIVADRDPLGTCLYIDENINVPGIALSEYDGRVTFSHLYPTYVNRRKDVYTWRMLPAEQGLTRTVGFSFSLRQEDSYAEMLRTDWREAYGRYGTADKRYTARSVYETLIDAVQRSYSQNNIWGSVPQYMTNADHYFPDSGFLYRNLELATLMLREGRARSRQDMVDAAVKVIDYQLKNDRLDANMGAYGRDNSVFKRVLFESLSAAVDLYVYELGCGGNAVDLDALLGYIVDKGELYRDETSLMALTFYMNLYRNRDVLFVDYEDVARALLERAYRSTEDYGGYYGGVESTNTLISVAEDYMILLRAFLDAYEINGELKWLEKAERLGDYLETYQMIQPFQLNLVGATGAEGYNLAFMGNERFLAHGYIFNNTQHGILDIANTSSVIDYYRLFEYTKDEHYRAFAESKLYNAMLYVNMGDKVGHMDDLLHSAGKGFMNEFVGNATTVAGFADGGIRGAAHDSNIAWNIYQIVTIFDYFNRTCGDILPEGIGAELEHDLAGNKNMTGESASPAQAAHKAVDGNADTYWQPAGNGTAVLDLNEYCQISQVRLRVQGSAAAQISFSRDGVNFGGEQSMRFDGDVGTADCDGLARYVRIAVSGGAAVRSLEVLGVPVFYETMSYGAALVSGSGNAADCLDESNYRTAWNADNGSLVLDLGRTRAIFQTALKPQGILACAYLIEISDDNVNYRTYAQSDGTQAKLVFVDALYAEARYVRLTVTKGAEPVKISDFKVMGA